MNFAKLFLADLPPEAELTRTDHRGLSNTQNAIASDTSKAARRKALSAFWITWRGEWLSADFPFRREVLESGPAATGFSKPVLAAGLDQFFKQLTAENLEALLRQELGTPHRLDGFHPDEHQVTGKRIALARGPLLLLVQIAPGNLPNRFCLK